MKRIEINNQNKLELYFNEQGLSVIKKDENDFVERIEIIPDGDIVMLFNYWRNCKNGTEISDYVTRSHHLI